MDLSIVIALYNEKESLPELLERIRDVLDKPLGANENTLPVYEVLFVDDGSKDGSWDFIAEVAKKDVRIRGIRFVAITENPRPSIAVLKLHKAM